nr:MAG TPA: hypothetical protein [Caudoviricetes sp.]
MLEYGLMVGRSNIRAINKYRSRSDFVTRLVDSRP